MSKGMEWNRRRERSYIRNVLNLPPVGESHAAYAVANIAKNTKAVFIFIVVYICFVVVLLFLLFYIYNVYKSNCFSTSFSVHVYMFVFVYLCKCF